MQRFLSLGSFGYCSARVHLIYAQALDAGGLRARARQIVNQGRVRHLRQADKIDDPAFRTTFLQGSPEYQQLTALAAAWDG